MRSKIKSETGGDFGSSAWEFDSRSVPSWCGSSGLNLYPLSSLGFSGFIQKTECVTHCPTGSLLVGPDGWSQAYVWMGWLGQIRSFYTGFMTLIGSDGGPTTAQSCVLSWGHRVWRLDAGRQPVTDGCPGGECGWWAGPQALIPP